jgi:hypothetical protein
MFILIVKNLKITKILTFFFFKGSGLQLTLRQEEIPLDPDIASPSFLSFQAI